MAPFEFKLENHFVGSSDGTSLQVYELTKSSAHFSSIQKADWKKVATIPKQDDFDDDASYDGLLFFNERIEEPEVLTMLAEHLKELRLLASPEGYCFQRVSDFGIHYLRLNDLFSWPRYGVKLVTVNTWSRLELNLLKDDHDHGHDDLEEEEANRSEVDKEELQRPTKWTNINVIVRELQRQLRRKDVELRMLRRKKIEEDRANEETIQELEKLNEDLEEANGTKDEELQKLHKQLKRKDDQLEMLKKKKDVEEEASEKRIAELEKQNEDSEEARRAKDKELQKLHKQLKKKDGELQALKKKAEEKSNRIEELEEMFEDLEDEFSKLKKVESELRKLLKLKEDELQALRKKKQDDVEGKQSKLREELEARKNEELEKLKKEKDDEISKILREKNDEAAKTRKVEGELKEAREKLSSSVAEVAAVKKELEEENKRIKEAEDEVSKLKKSKSELRKLLKLKENELQGLREKKQDDVEAKLSKLREELEARKNEELEKLKKEKDEELKEAREKLSSSVAGLEKCQRNSWVILPSTKFIKRFGSDGTYLATRQRVPPEIFSCSRASNIFMSNSHKLVNRMSVYDDYIVRLVDEERSEQWPPLPKISVSIGRDGSEFDKDNWWYLKTTHPEGGLTMLVYYEGNRSQITVSTSDGNRGAIFPLPFPSADLEIYSRSHKFSIFWLEPVGVRFGFAYRPT